jgi:hypothetical protein
LLYGLAGKRKIRIMLLLKLLMGAMDFLKALLLAQK